MTAETTTENTVFDLLDRETRNYAGSRSACALRTSTALRTQRRPGLAATRALWGTATLYSSITGNIGACGE